jgi:hypothetical protein
VPEPVTSGPTRAAGEALERGGVQDQRVERGGRGAADDGEALLALDVDGHAEVGAGADVGAVLDAHLEHVDLDVELAALHVELVDDGLEVLVVCRRGDDDERAGVLVRGDLDVAGEQVGRDGAAGGLVLVGAGLRGLLGAGGQRGEHGGHGLGVRVLELADVDATAAAGQLDVEALDQAADDDVVGLVGDDDQGAGALIDDDAVDRRGSRRRAAAALALGRGRLAALGALAEDVTDDLRDLLGLGVLQLIEEDLLAGGRGVELGDDALEAADARALVGQDDQVADYVDAALLALELVEDVADVLGAAVLDADQLGGRSGRCWARSRRRHRAAGCGSWRRSSRRS